jgi:spermidine/putrescine transport system permease protein
MATDAEALALRTDTRRRWVLTLPAVTIISLFSILPLGVVVVYYSFLTPGRLRRRQIRPVSRSTAGFQVLFERDIFDDTVTVAERAHLSISWRSVKLS